MANKYYFFTDINTLSTQSSGEFGPAGTTTSGSNTYDQYRVSSMHTSSADAPAIAICKGTIFVQEQDATHLNIVLKPFEQAPFEFPKIKYFIYKGILKNSLINSSDKIVAKATNEITNELWTSYGSYNNVSTAPPKDVLGLDITPNTNGDSSSLDAIFYRTGVNNQLPIVNGGWKMGNFDQTGFGFEIMFESLGFEPTLALVRNNEHIIKVKQIAGATQAEFFEHWHDKEEILNYIDPCAFFGCFYNKNLLVYNGSSFDNRNGEDIYTNVLSKFTNKDKCYVDIRNEFNFSLNYFKNYGSSATNNTTNVSLKKGASTSVTLNYYDNNWPILILNYTGFSGSVTTHQTLGIKLPCNSGSNNDDNPAPLVYLDKAYFPNSKFPDEFVLKDKFLPLNVSSHFTDEFSIGLPCKNGALLSCYSRIKFCKRNSNSSLPSPVDTQIRRTDSLESIFSTKMNFSPTSINTKVFNENIYIDTLESNGFDAVFSLGINFDSNNVTLFAVPSNYSNFENNKAKNPLSITDEKSIGNYLKKLGEISEASNLTKVTVSTTQGEGDVDTLVYQETYIGFLQKFNTPELKHLLGLGFTVAEWSSIISLASNSSNFTQKYPVFLSISNKQTDIDSNNNHYTVFDFKLKGYKLNGNNISVATVDANIKQYSYGDI